MYHARNSVTLQIISMGSMLDLSTTIENMGGGEVNKPENWHPFGAQDGSQTLEEAVAADEKAKKAEADKAAADDAELARLQAEEDRQAKVAADAAEAERIEAQRKADEAAAAERKRQEAGAQ